VLKDVVIQAAGAEGNCIARWDGRVIFVKNAAPGDICDLRIIGSKKKFLLAEIIEIKEESADRVTPFCEHFGVCGGCKWQHMSYDAQLTFKSQQVRDAFDRIGKLEYDEIPQAIGSAQTTFYRNKLEFTFGAKRWMTKEEISNEDFVQSAGLGFHVPGRWDKVVHVNKCWLQDEVSNRIRNFCYNWVKEKSLTSYDPRLKEGLMRNLMLRNTKNNEWMVLLTFHRDSEAIKPMLEAIQVEFPEIKSLLFSINEKDNDSIYDLDIQLYKGEKFISEDLNGLRFKIRPKSFFQTNPQQAEVLYQTALDLADLSGHENVYDLYCGTGTISLLAARKAKHVIGIESVPQAIEDANENAKSNDIDNATFFVGDMKEIFSTPFILANGKPDVIITDPPRAGMHTSVITQINESGCPKVVYVSCNPATQARDLDLMRNFYDIDKVQPIDMFPHTHHIENVVVLKRKEES